MTNESIDTTDSNIDPILSEIDDETLYTIGKRLNIQEADKEKLKIDIWNRMSSEAKEHSLTRAWFPKNAESYLEVLVVTAKTLSISLKGTHSLFELEQKILFSYLESINQGLPVAEQIDIVKVKKHFDTAIDFIAFANGFSPKTRILNLILYSDKFKEMVPQVAILIQKSFEKSEKRVQSLVPAIVAIAEWRSRQARKNLKGLLKLSTFKIWPYLLVFATGALFTYVFLKF